MKRFITLGQSLNLYTFYVVYISYDCATLKRNNTTGYNCHRIPHNWIKISQQHIPIDGNVINVTNVFSIIQSYIKDNPK